MRQREAVRAGGGRGRQWEAGGGSGRLSDAEDLETHDLIVVDSLPPPPPTSNRLKNCVDEMVCSYELYTCV